jgi:hypothetical protein
MFRLADAVAAIAVIAAVVVIVQRFDDPPARESEQQQSRAGDRDGDGVRDSEDLAPDVPGERTPEATPTPEEPPLPPVDDCRRKGITRGKGLEGACYEPSGRRVRVVDRDSRLDLDELAAELRGIDVQRRPALRRAVVTVRLSVRNKLNGIVDFRPEQAGLLLGRGLFSPDEREPVRAGSLVRRAASLRPGEGVEGTLRFEVPLRAVDRLDRDGNLQLLQFSDISLAAASTTVGIFRTYR